MSEDGKRSPKAGRTLVEIGSTLPEVNVGGGPNYDWLYDNLEACKQKPGVYFQVAAQTTKKPIMALIDRLVDQTREDALRVPDGEFDIDYLRVDERDENGTKTGRRVCAIVACYEGDEAPDGGDSPE